MGSKFSTMIALCCTVVYLIAIGVAVNRILGDLNDRRSAAEVEFTDLVDRASAAAVLSFMDQPFLETLRDSLRNARALRAVIITGPMGTEYAIERHQGYLTWEEDKPSFVKRFGLTGEPYFAPLRVEGMRNVSVQGVAEYMDGETLGRILTYTLIAVGAALALALVTLLFEAAKNTEARRESGRAGLSPAVPPESEEEPFDLPTLDPDITGNLGTGPGVRQEVPTGLFSPRSNISWESYTHDRLDSELHRSGSFEQDLVFVAMKLKVAEMAPTVYKEFSSAATSFFTFRDLIFERGYLGISVILPNIDLDHGFRMAEEFRNKFLKRVTTQGFRELSLYIGLTSRSGRLVDADRIMVEAGRALTKAEESDTSAIVAFKSDPERYRAFLANH